MDVKKKVDIEIKSNIDKIMNQTKSLDTAVKRLTAELNKAITQDAKNYENSLKNIGKELSLLNKELENKRKQADIQKEILKIQKQYESQVEETNKAATRMVESYNRLKSFDFSGLIKGNLSNLFDNIEKSKIGKINLKANVELENIEVEKKAGIDAANQAASDKTKTALESEEAAVGKIDAETAKQVQAEKASANRLIGTKTYWATKKLSEANARIEQLIQDRDLLKNHAGYPNVKKLYDEKIAEEQKNITGIKSGLSADVEAIKANRNAKIEELLEGRAEKISGVKAGTKEKLADIEAEKAGVIASVEGEAGKKAAKVQGQANADAAKFGAKMAMAKIAADAILDVSKKIWKGFKDILNDTLGVNVSVKDNLKAVLNEVGNIMDLKSGAATFATSTSLITNASAREQQMKYGLSEAQNYALRQTMTMMGMSSDDDLMYMNREQTELFRTFMGKYDAWYSEMKSSGVLRNVQEFQLDFAMFKQELAMDFMSWFAENKDELMKGIKTIAKVTMKIAEWVLKILESLSGSFIGGLFGLGGEMSESDRLSQVMSDYTTYNTSNNNNSKTVTVNMNQNNTATGVLSNQGELQSFFNDQMKNLSQEIALQLE